MKRRIISALSVLVILCVLTMNVYAIEVPDLSRNGSISLTMTYQGETVAGGSLTLYRVAEVSVENGADYSFRYVAPYDECEVSLEALSSAKTAQELADYTAAESISGVTAEIDDKGCVTFKDLELGLYLLVQEEPAEGFNAVSPFLVSVPGKHIGSYVYDVDASPKLDLTEAPTEPTEPSTEPPTEPVTEPTMEPTTEPTKPTQPTTPSLPQTGQNNWPVPVLALIGIFFVAVGWCLCASGRKKSHEE